MTLFTIQKKLRDELISIAYGIWDFVKNSGEYDADNWELDFVGFLPGKRESRRYVGDYIMNQNDVRDGGHFDDIAAYGGWTMDDHNPAGINTKDKPNIFHPAPSPFGIPYRCLYSVNIENLLFCRQKYQCYAYCNERIESYGYLCIAWTSGRNCVGNSDKKRCNTERNF